MSQHWEVYQLKYSEKTARTRKDNFLFDDRPNEPSQIDFFIWVLKNGDRTILVDTGCSRAEAERRGMPMLREPTEALTAFGVDPASIDTVIITHMHFDHAGGLNDYPAATFHLQETEMAYATGICVTPGSLQIPFTADHVCDMVRLVFDGRVVFHDGDGEVAPGVTVHLTGGHSKGHQAVRVETRFGPICLAVDAAHFYENFQAGKLFPIIHNAEEMQEGFRIIRRLAEGDDDRVFTGHDPLSTERYPAEGDTGFVWRLDSKRIA